MGLKADKEHHLGASAKRELAEKLRSKKDEEMKFKSRDQFGSSFYHILFAFIAALVFAGHLTETYMAEYALFNVSVGSNTTDQMLFGPGVPYMSDIPSLDYGFTVFVRAIMFMAVTGFLPFVTYLVGKALDQTNDHAFLMVWCTTITMFVIFQIFYEPISALL
jgi:hypothetical protein